MKKFSFACIGFFGVSFSLAAFQVGPDGSANYSVPIRVMPGVNGLQPNLSISYNSNAPNGTLGVGFLI